MSQESVMTDIIFIKGLSLEAIVGISEFERNYKQPLILDLELSIDARLPAKTDSIHDAVAYDLIIAYITEFVANSQYNLIESLATEIAEEILKRFNVQKVRCTLYKPQAVSNAVVGISIERTKEN